MRERLTYSTSLGFLQGLTPNGKLVKVAHDRPGPQGFRLFWQGHWHSRFGQLQLKEEFLIAPREKENSPNQKGYPSEPVIMALWRYLVDRWNDGDAQIQFRRSDRRLNETMSETIHSEHIGFVEESDIEGLKTEIVLYRTKRSRKLRDAALEAANGECCVCNRNFSKLLGGRGKRVLQVHHRDQLSAREAPSVTKQSDLAVVCANCHLLLHLDPKKALGVPELREMLRADGFYN